MKQIDPLLQKNKWAVPCMKMSDEPTPYMPNASEPVRLLASPFRAAGATLFTEIQLDWQYPEIGIDSSARKLNIGPEMFEGEAKEMELVSVV